MSEAPDTTPDTTPDGAAADPDDSVRLRRMRWFDIEAVAVLDGEAFGADAWSTEFFWSALATPGSSFVVLDAGGAESGQEDSVSGGAASDDTASGASIFGFAGLSVSGPQAEVLTIATDPRVRGRGWGALLLDHLLDRARAAGCEVIHLDVRSDNDAALRLYDSRGFSEIGRRAAYYTGADALIMRAFLRDP